MRLIPSGKQSQRVGRSVSVSADALLGDLHQTQGLTGVHRGDGCSIRGSCRLPSSSVRRFKNGCGITRYILHVCGRYLSPVQIVTMRLPATRSPLTMPGVAGKDSLLLTFPSTDTLFRHVAASVIEGASSETLQRHVARSRLRERFPDADLQQQRDVLIGGVPTETWFAFRDGRGRPTYPSDSWWTEPTVASATVHANGQLMHCNRPFKDLLELPRSLPAVVLANDVLPRAINDELSPDALWLPQVGEVTSTAVISVARSTPANVEFHAVWEGGGQDRHQLMLRSFQERDSALERNAMRKSSFGVLSRSSLSELARGASTRVLAQGERLPEPIVGDPWVALVVAGVVRVYLVTKGLEPTVFYARHGSLLGTHLGVGARALDLWLQAVTPTRLIRFDPRRVQSLLESRLPFANAVSEDARSMLRHLMRGFALRSSASLRERLASELLLLRQMEPANPLVAVTEQQLADGLGSIRESVARTIADFRRRGWVATTRYGVLPLSVEALRGVADAG